MFTIGEFSKITGLTIKALRLYHEKGLLIPPVINLDSKYRAYDSASVRKARIITRLKEIGFSLAEIKNTLDSCGDEADLTESLVRHKDELSKRIERDKNIIKSIEFIIEKEKEAEMKSKESDFLPEVKRLPEILIAGYKMTGKYSIIGQGFGKLRSSLHNGVIAGQGISLFYDSDYREDEASFEACFPVSKEITAEGISCRMLPAGKAVTILHKGSHETLGGSYQKLFEFIGKNGYEAEVPFRHVYVKGPGTILGGDPDNYLTEIQVFVK